MSSLVARVFRWAHQVLERPPEHCGYAFLPVAAGVVPGGDYRSLARWKHRFVRPGLDQLDFQGRQAEVAQLCSVARFNLCHPCLTFRSAIHSPVTEWTLARCGIHPLHGWACCSAPAVYAALFFINTHFLCSVRARSQCTCSLR